ncbi:hypothetical protein IAR55_002633 [Kwoniella newhampshirensis]|uniref:Methyltransferase domain-containing protein n=1 Tax=Kwoniella newhampshirensis TaxID=1651941 RepID=A0AAW0YSD3_9TREE
MPLPTDFSSAEYWSTRFETERSFEWLVPTSTLIPLIVECLGVIESDEHSRNTSTPASTSTDRPVHILHLGCGTSSLSSSLLHHLTDHPGEPTPQHPGIRYRIHDSDYISPPKLPSSPIQFHQVDLLSLSTLRTTVASLSNHSKKDAQTTSQSEVVSSSSYTESRQSNLFFFDLLIDKSTSDAISCSSPLPPEPDPDFPEEELPTDPVERLLYNLSKVVRKGGRWLSVSYSDKRYDCLLPHLESSASRSTGTSNDHFYTSNSLEEDRLRDGDDDAIGGRRNQHQPRDDEEAGKPSKGVVDSDEHTGEISPKVAWLGWKIVRKEMIATTYIPGGRRVRDGNSERIVYEPETGVWAYVLERI